ncbi:hypothetical protein BDW68DRAFT_146099 [Aspergillus falconensis]
MPYKSAVVASVLLSFSTSFHSLSLSVVCLSTLPRSLFRHLYLPWGGHCCHIAGHRLASTVPYASYSNCSRLIAFLSN